MEEKKHITRAAIPVQPGPSLTEQVTDMVQRQIVGGVYGKGDMLPSEQSLAVNYGVSRAVIREAIARLKANGLVIARHGRGLYVASTVAHRRFEIEGDATSRDSIQKILDLRMSLEVEAAGLAAARREAKHLREMRRTLDAMAKAVAAKALEPGVKADLRFHEAVCAATKNELFVDFFNFLSPYLAGAITITRQNSMERLGRICEVENEHQTLFAAIEGQNEDAARRAARSHIANTMSRIASLPADPPAMQPERRRTAAARSAS